MPGPTGPSVLFAAKAGNTFLKLKTKNIILHNFRLLIVLIEQSLSSDRYQNFAPIFFKSLIFSDFLM
jgi:hypothetical protein